MTFQLSVADQLKSDCSSYWSLLLMMLSLPSQVGRDGFRSMQTTLIYLSPCKHTTILFTVHVQSSIQDQAASDSNSPTPEYKYTTPEAQFLNHDGTLFPIPLHCINLAILNRPQLYPVPTTTTVLSFLSQGKGWQCQLVVNRAGCDRRRG